MTGNQALLVSFPYSFDAKSSIISQRKNSLNLLLLQTRLLLLLTTQRTIFLINTRETTQQHQITNIVLQITKIIQQRETAQQHQITEHSDPNYQNHTTKKNCPTTSNKRTK